MNSAINSISSQITKINQLMESEQQFNKKYIFDAIYADGDSNRSSDIDFQNQGTTKSLNFSEPEASESNQEPSKDLTTYEPKIMKKDVLNDNWLNLNEAQTPKEGLIQNQSCLFEEKARNFEIKKEKVEKNRRKHSDRLQNQNQENKQDIQNLIKNVQNDNSKVFSNSTQHKTQKPPIQNQKKIHAADSDMRKLNRDELQKIKDLSMSGLAKVTTNRNKKKTKRGMQITNVKSSAHFVGEYVNSRKKTLQEKQGSWKITHGVPHESQNDSIGYKKSMNPSKQWEKSLDRYRKINRVNINKLQENVKKGHPPTNFTKSANYNLNTTSQKKANSNSKNMLLKNISNNERALKKNDNTVSGKKIHSKNPSSILKSKKIKNNDREDNENIQMSDGKSQPHFFVEKLNFNQKKSVMQRILQSKNIFKSYALATKKYIQTSKKITQKECRNIQKEIRAPTEEAIFKMKMITSITLFFTQFFNSSGKTIMGMISKSFLQQEKKKNQKSCSSPRTVSLDNLIISLLENPKEIIQIIQCLPNKLYNKNILSQASISEMLQSYESINEQLDSEFEFFLIKKSNIYEFFHELTEYILYLKMEDLISETERKNLNENRTVRGYYSSRSKRDLQKVKVSKKKNPHCDSQRRITVQDLETERYLKR